MSRMFLDLDDGTEGCQWVPRVFLDLVQGSEPASSSRLLKAAYAFYFWERNAWLELCVLLEAKKVSSVVLLLLDFTLTQHNKGLILKAPACLFLHSLGAR